MQALFAYILLALLISNNGAAAVMSPGEFIYRQGMLPTGEPLSGNRAGDINVTGPDAACVSCHRRSGLGMQEGRYIIPPIIGKYLYRPGLKSIEDLNSPHVAGYLPNRSAYTDQTLARAIREGVDADGRPLNYLMPRFDLDDAAMASLIKYLKELTSKPVPGVTDDILHFATIITPDADPIKKQGMLNVLDQFFSDKNAFIRGGGKALHTSRDMKYRVTRKWRLHVWELTGPAETWQAQLHQHLVAEPVFAVISGLGGNNWEPVHRFCEQDEIPCLFPNIERPVIAENDFYSIYFSKGVMLEAQLIAHQIKEELPKIHRVIQVYSHDDIGADAAKALRTAIQPFGLASQDILVTKASTPQQLADILKGKADSDAVVLWFRPEELSKLPKKTPEMPSIFISGLMGGLEDAPVPPTWRSSIIMSYPFDLPEKRKIRMDFPLMWFKVRHIPVTSERIQSDTYLACGILAETLSGMLDSFVRDYLIEQMEVMLDKRVLTGYYPRLSLAQGQRFGSKGGYLVGFSGQEGNKLVADSAWVVP